MVAGVRDIVRAIEGFSSLLAVFAGVFPGAALYSFAPPEFRVISPLASMVALAVIVFGFNRKIAKKKAALRALVFALLAFIFAAVYWPARKATTVEFDPPHASIEQVGFGRAEWGLTATGLKHWRKNPELSGKGIVLEFATDDMSVIWTDASILLATVLLSLLFVAMAAFWAYSMSMLCVWNRAVRASTKSPPPARSVVGFLLVSLSVAALASCRGSSHPDIAARIENIDDTIRESGLRGENPGSSSSSTEEESGL